MNQMFRTLVDIPPHPRPIELGEQLLSLGSCFAEHMGQRLADNRFALCQNPTGILYNPACIASALERLATATPYREQDLFEHGGLWRSFDHHSRFAHSDPHRALQAINSALVSGGQALRRADCLILTFGSAFAYFLAGQPARPVANCHRLPADTFHRRRLEIGQIVSCCAASVERLRRLRPRLRLLLTVSPVRHLRDQAHENLVSKSTLVLAAETLVRTLPDAYYFPSYEIMMDDLRDYRFYEADMVHPSQTAQDYIWTRFQEACLSAQARDFVRDYEPVRKARRHRWQHDLPGQMRSFAQAQLQRLQALQTQYPTANLQPDLEHFNRILSA